MRQSQRSEVTSEAVQGLRGNSNMDTSGNQVVPGEERQIEIPWFATPVYSEEEVEMYSIGQKEEETFIQSKFVEEPNLPEDPRMWSRADVCDWVLWMCALHNLPPPNIERFLMNGKAVCLMNVSMFSSRVPLGGKLLYRDFQIRLANALYKKH